ncbi:MAG: hypothetical protein U0872_14400 [Planctomycetaceae bacterium]
MAARFGASGLGEITTTTSSIDGVDMNFDRHAALKLPTSISHRTRFLSHADRSVIQTINRGVLFVMAFWSGSSRLALHSLANAIETVDIEGQLELVVVDADDCSDIYDLWAESHLTYPSGAGEAVWIKDGRIMHTSGLGYNPDRFVLNTKLLLDGYNS